MSDEGYHTKCYYYYYYYYIQRLKPLLLLDDGFIESSFALSFSLVSSSNGIFIFGILTFPLFISDKLTCRTVPLCGAVSNPTSALIVAVGFI